MMIMAVGSATNAFADGPTVSVNLTAGALTETSGIITWTTPVATLSGVAQDAVYTFPITVDDATGSAAGWNLTITSTTFTGTGGHSLAATASTISAVTIGTGTGTAPVSTGAPTYSMALPGASTTAVKFFSAQASTGMGSSMITPTIHIAIPADARADAYSSILTVASVSAP